MRGLYPVLETCKKLHRQLAVFLIMSSANASEAEEILHLLFTEDNIQDTGQAPQTGRESQDVAFRLSYRYLYMRLKVTKTHFMGQLSRQVTE